MHNQTSQGHSAEPEVSRTPPRQSDRGGWDTEGEAQRPCEVVHLLLAVLFEWKRLERVLGLELLFAGVGWSAAPAAAATIRTPHFEVVRSSFPCVGCFVIFAFVWRGCFLLLFFAEVSGYY